VYPFERLTLDARTGANIALFAALCDRAAQSSEGDGTAYPNFAIASSDDAQIGTVANIDPTAPRPSWVGGAIRIHARSLYTFEVLRTLEAGDEAFESTPWCLHGRGYFSLCLARKLQDCCSPRVPPDCFPLICRASRSLKQNDFISTIVTRRRARTKAKRISMGVRSSLLDISARTWATYNEVAVLKRVRAAAAAPHGIRLLELDEHLITSTPRDSDPPTRWSYWFGAALSGNTSKAQQLEILKERVPVLRLRIILDILQRATKVGKSARESRAGMGKRNASKRVGTRSPSAVKRARQNHSPGGLPLLSPGASQDYRRTQALPIFDARSFSRVRWLGQKYSVLHSI
jgi:hypothetical protein